MSCLHLQAAALPLYVDPLSLLTAVRCRCGSGAKPTRSIEQKREENFDHKAGTGGEWMGSVLQNRVWLKPQSKAKTKGGCANSRQGCQRLQTQLGSQYRQQGQLWSNIVCMMCTDLNSLSGSHAVKLCEHTLMCMLVCIVLSLLL